MKKYEVKQGNKSHGLQYAESDMFAAGLPVDDSVNWYAVEAR